MQTHYTATRNSNGDYTYKETIDINAWNALTELARRYKTLHEEKNDGSLASESIQLRLDLILDQMMILDDLIRAGEPVHVWRLEQINANIQTVIELFEYKEVGVEQ